MFCSCRILLTSASRGPSAIAELLVTKMPACDRRTGRNAVAAVSLSVYVVLACSKNARCKNVWTIYRGPVFTKVSRLVENNSGRDRCDVFISHKRCSHGDNFWWGGRLKRNCHIPPLFIVLAFHNGLEDRNADRRFDTGDESSSHRLLGRVGYPL